MSLGFIMSFVWSTLSNALRIIKIDDIHTNSYSLGNVNRGSSGTP